MAVTNRALMMSQKNELLALVKAAGIDPFGFKWHTVNSRRSVGDFESRGDAVSQLYHKLSGYLFTFDFSAAKMVSEYSPGSAEVTEVHVARTWFDRLKCFRRWLTYLDRELSASDEWAALTQYELPAGLDLDPDEGNSSFTVEEVDQILSGIGMMREYLELEFDGVEDSLHTIHGRLEYLESSAKRQGRRDWILSSIGVLATLGSTLSLSQAQGVKLVAFLKQAVSGIVRLLGA